MEPDANSMIDAAFADIPADAAGVVAPAPVAPVEPAPVTPTATVVAPPVAPVVPEVDHLAQWLEDPKPVAPKAPAITAAQLAANQQAIAIQQANYRHQQEMRQMQANLEQQSKAAQLAAETQAQYLREQLEFQRQTRTEEVERARLAAMPEWERWQHGITSSQDSKLDTRLRELESRFEQRQTELENKHKAAAEKYQGWVQQQRALAEARGAANTYAKELGIDDPQLLGQITEEFLTTAATFNMTPQQVLEQKRRVFESVARARVRSLQKTKTTLLAGQRAGGLPQAPRVPLAQSAVKYKGNPDLFLEESIDEALALGLHNGFNTR